MNCIEVKVPLVSSLCLLQTIEEDIPPLWAKDHSFEVIIDGCVGALNVEISETVHVVPEFGDGLVVVLVGRSTGQSEVSCYMFEMIASSCKGHFSSDSVPAQSCH